MTDKAGHRNITDGDDKSHNKRRIRSFVRREGRITRAQQHALDTLWSTHGIDFASTLLNWDEIFGCNAPVVLEIGFGNGEALAELAKRHPELNFIGVEVHRPGIGHLLNCVAEKQLTNVRVVKHDVVEFLDAMVPAASLDRVNVWFPDPWPKKRHHKRRLIQPEFLKLLANRMKPGALLHLATDWQNYAEHMLDALAKVQYFDNTTQGDDLDSACVARPNTRPLTKFERRGHRKGHGVWDFLFERNQHIT